MGFFEKLFGRKNQMEPFPENQSDAEKLNWFRKTQPWDEVDEKIINAIIKKYNGDPMIVAFVVTSMRSNLVPIYCKYNNSEYLDSPDLICSLVAQALYDLGSRSLKQIVALSDDISGNREEFRRHYSIVMDSFDSCIIIDENQVSAYSGLAIARGILNKSEDVLKYAKQGLAIIQKIRESNVPFQLSKDENIRNSMQTFEEIENQLNQMIAGIKDV